MIVRKKICGKTYRVQVKAYNNRAIVVNIRAFGHVFKGRSRVNTEEGDVFDMNTGIELAMHRALVQFTGFYNRFVLGTAEDTYQRAKQHKEKVMCDYSKICSKLIDATRHSVTVNVVPTPVSEDADMVSLESSVPA